MKWLRMIPRRLLLVASRLSAHASTAASGVVSYSNEMTMKSIPLALNNSYQLSLFVP